MHSADRNYPESAYIHIPFCAAKCGYCDFNSYAGLMPIAQRYVDALCRQIRSESDHSTPLKTVYFGGGTPSILSSRQLCSIYEALAESFGIDESAEVTLEANPESALLEKLRDLRQAGFNRISIGAQSFDDLTLQRIGRVHSHARFLEAYDNARQAGFDNISIDLMFGLPGQTISDLELMLSEAIKLAPEHISAYCLTIEEGTAFFDLADEGRLDLPDEDTVIEMFQMTHQMLTSAGYEHYEISNYALNGQRCRHNEAYWRNESYRGFGTGAVAYVNGHRLKWETNPESYVLQIEMTGSPRIVETETLEESQLLGETAMLALRTSDGLDINRLNENFNLDSAAFFSTEIERYSSMGLLERSNGHIRLTQQGLLVSNEVLAAFLR